MSSEVSITDSKVKRTLGIISGVLFGLFLVMIFLARSIVY